MILEKTHSAFRVVWIERDRALELPLRLIGEEGELEPAGADRLHSHGVAEPRMVLGVQVVDPDRLLEEVDGVGGAVVLECDLPRKNSARASDGLRRSTTSKSARAAANSPWLNSATPRATSGN
jgi:hypothetical protein